LNPLVYPPWWGGPQDDSNKRVENYRKKKNKFENDKRIDSANINTTQSRENIESNNLRKTTYGYQLKNDIVNRKDIRY
jgi:hypothetical protein